MMNKIDKRGVQVVWSFSRSRQFVAEIRRSCPRPPSPTNRQTEKKCVAIRYGNTVCLSPVHFGYMHVCIYIYKLKIMAILCDLRTECVRVCMHACMYIKYFYKINIYVKYF